MLVTVATPAYNRANLLPRLYQSLCLQTCTDFEWLIVDDGSTDNTEKIVYDFIQEKRIPIRYIKKTNGGKHTAVNVAAREAKGELLFISDSDDWLPQNAIADVKKAYLKVRKDSNLAGVCGLDAYADGSLVGDSLPQDEIDASPQEIRGRWGIRGDMKEVFRTSVMREFPFPEIPGERFCPEVLIWNRIGKHYKLRYINKPIYTVEYQPDGITSAITRMRMRSPIASMMTYSEWFSQATTFKSKLRLAINYWRFSFCSKKNHLNIAAWTYVLAPIGLMMHLNDKRTVNL